MEPLAIDANSSPGFLFAPKKMTLNGIIEIGVNFISIFNSRLFEHVIDGQFSLTLSTLSN